MFINILFGISTLIINIVDFRHTLTVQPAERSRPRLLSYSSPETPPGSPGIGRLRAYVLPEMGKGKTWGPSSFHQKERSQLDKPESPKRWSKSAPNLEKSLKNGPVVGTLQDIGKLIFFFKEILN
jgi:mitogen-activated protein kinase kinase kinase 9